jgi:integrase
MMAYIRKDKDKWRAQVEVAGVRISRSFATKSAATQWAAAEEMAIRSGSRAAERAQHSLADAIKRYQVEVSADKRGGPLEVKRFGALARDYAGLCATDMREVTTQQLANWRDSRLALVSAGSVQRDINLLRNVWTVAAHEWGWCDAPGPWLGLRAPGENPARDRRVSRHEIWFVMRWAGFLTGVAPKSKTAEAAWAFLLSLRTGMRAGELLQIKVSDCDLSARVVTLRTHKTMEAVGPRRVPITKQAARLFAVLCDSARDQGRENLFTPTSPQLDALWRRLTRQCLLKNLHFHDARGEALTLLARRVDVMTLARISGHRDLNILLNTYYRERPEQIAARL